MNAKANINCQKRWQSCSASVLLAQAHADELAPIAWYSWLYNPTGKLLNIMGTPNLASYQERFAELETLRQQAVAPMADKLSLQ